MGNVTFKLEIGGLNKLMKSSNMQEILNNAGERVATAAGGGEYKYIHSTHVATWTALGDVAVANKKAAEDNADNNTLLKALGSARF